MCFAPPYRSLRVLRRPARCLVAAPEQGVAPPTPREWACPLPIAVAMAPLTLYRQTGKENFLAAKTRSPVLSLCSCAMVFVYIYLWIYTFIADIDLEVSYVE
jgi:hypothetical protein